jgi:hypothetical protein
VQGLTRINKHINLFAVFLTITTISPHVNAQNYTTQASSPSQTGYYPSQGNGHPSYVVISHESMNTVIETIREPNARTLLQRIRSEITDNDIAFKLYTDDQQHAGACNIYLYDPSTRNLSNSGYELDSHQCRQFKPYYGQKVASLSNALINNDYYNLVLAYGLTMNPTTTNAPPQSLIEELVSRSEFITEFGVPALTLADALRKGPDPTTTYNMHRVPTDTYRVTPGDNLSSIEAESNMSWASNNYINLILGLNSQEIQNANLIYSGQDIYLPVAPDTWVSVDTIQQSPNTAGKKITAPSFLVKSALEYCALTSIARENCILPAWRTDAKEN